MNELRRFSLFAYGFRPFFWAAGAFAVLAIAAWLWMYTHGMVPLPDQPSQLWHGHEMLHGFIGAAIAGFLLTAVPSWTGARGFAGMPLVLLVAIWVAGRLAFAASATLPFAVVAACELAFLPALTILIAPPLLRARNRNTPLLIVIAGIWLTDVFFMYGVDTGDVSLARTSLFVALDVILLLVTVIGGRIVPAFTASGLRNRGVPATIRSNRVLDGATIASMAALVVIDVTSPSSRIAGYIAGLAALLHALRLSGWNGLRTLREPLVWCLHLAYAWMPVGLALKAIFLLTGVAWSAFWLHALTIGVAAGMILAVTTRASLGHTGRPLATSRVTATAYLLLGVAALIRVFGPAVLPASYVWTVIGSGVLWMTAFGLFLIVYTPILMRPRVDGRPG